MRQTLHDYVVGHFEKWRSFPSEESSYLVCYKFAKLTNRAPRLGDFVPCDNEGNVLEKPECDCLTVLDKERCGQWDKKHPCMEYQQAFDRVIFKGDWKVIEGSNSDHTRIYCKQLNTTIDFELSGVSLIRTDSIGFVLERGVVNRIEELPSEIEFKDGVV